MENKFELTKEILEKMLSEKSMTFTYKEIEELMDSEVEKPEEEMDTELVSMCAEILAKKYCPENFEEKTTPMFRPWELEDESATPAAPKKKRIITFKRVLFVAAALVLVVFVIALPVGASLFDNQASDKIIEFYADHFKINLRKEETTNAQNSDSDMVSEMIIKNLDNFLLPEELRSDEYEKTSARLTQNDYMTTFYIDIANASNEISGRIMITQYKDENATELNGIANVSDMYKNFKQISIDEMEIIVFGDSAKTYISYIDANADYNITLNCDFETAISIAETIKEKG